MRRTLVGFAVSVFALAAVLVGLVLVTFFPATSGYVPRGVARHVRQVFPEGWPLFTRDPPDFEARVAVQRSGRWVWVDRGPLAAPKNVFGFHKVAIAQNLEVVLIFARLGPKQQWARCRGDALVCLSKLDAMGARTPRVVSPRREDPTYCGRIGIVYLAPEPWGRRREHRMTRFLITDVACRGNA